MIDAMTVQSGRNGIANYPIRFKPTSVNHDRACECISEVIL